MKLIAKFTLAASTVCLVAEAQTSGLVGRWEHRFPGDSESDIIILRLEHDVLKGEYMGLEREGEHGLYYSATEVKNLEVLGGEIRFVVPPRIFFAKRPKSTAQANAWGNHSSGGSNEELQFHGRVVAEKLELACSSEFSGCPDTRMVFQKRTKLNNKYQRTLAGAAEH